MLNGSGVSFTLMESLLFSLFEEWSCIHQVQDAFNAELLKSHLQVADFLQR